MDYHKFGGYGVPMTGNVLGGYQQYLKVSNQILVPYSEETYKFKVDDEKKQENYSEKKDSGIKVFDDNTLDFECKKLTMQDIDKLDLSQSNISEEGILIISQSKNCCNITELNLSKNTYNITDVSLRYIAQSQCLNKLESLILDDSAITDYGLMYLTYPFTKPIELDTLQAIQRMRRNKKAMESTLGATGANFNSTAAYTHTSDSQTVFSESGRLHLYGNRLVKLSLQSLNITDKGFSCISFSQNIRLKYLNLQFTKITDKGLVEYFNSSNCAFLEYLDVSHQPITDESIKALSFSDFCKSLIVLKLDSCPLTNNSMLYLANSANSITISELNIATYIKSFMTGEAIKILGEAKYMSGLKVLNVDGQPFPETQLLQFIKSPIMKNIVKLSVGRNEDVSDNFCSSIYEFYQGEQYKSLKYLSLMKTSISERGVVLLQGLFQLVHSIENLKAMKTIKDYTRAGIKCYICDRCLMQQDTERELTKEKKPPINPHNCFICRVRPIKTIEYPAKACYGCGKGFQEKNCHLCQKQIGKHQLFRCHMCSIGYNKFKCFNCNNLIQIKH